MNKPVELALLRMVPPAERTPPGDSRTLPANIAKNPRLGQWIGLEQRGQVTVRTGKVELGQGIVTALAQIVAEELDVDLRRIAMVRTDTSLSPHEGTTTGSLSIAEGGSALRQAGAAARRVLLASAAERLGCQPQDLAVDDGRISAPGHGSVDYWDVYQPELFDCDIDLSAVPKPVSRYRIVGASAQRLDLPAKFSGAPSFVHDTQAPGLLYGRTVRPSRLDATLVSVDTRAAAALPGVRAIVRDGSFLGVVAEREEIALEAARLVGQGAQWRGGIEAPAQDGLEAFLRANVTRTSVIVDEPGDLAAPRRFRASYFKPYLSHGSIGPSAAVARFDGTKLQVWSHTQGVFILRRDLALALRMDESRITVTHAEGSGCYGHNAADDAALDAALLARAVPGHTVRLQWTREDEFRWSPVGPAMIVDLEAAIDDSGRIVGWSHSVWSNGHGGRPGDGFAADGSPTPALLAAWSLAQAFPRPPARNPAHPTYGAERNAVPLYAIPARVTSHYVGAEPLRTSAVRTLGAYMNVFAIESFMDEIARKAGVDPVEFRLRHMEDARARTVIRAAAERAGWGAWQRSEARGHGIAFARYKNHSAYCAVVAEVTVSHVVRLERLVVAVDVGLVVNPDGLASQIEGGAIQAASWTLKEEVLFDEAGITSIDWERYPILRFSEVPAVEVVIVNRPDMPSVGAGEAVSGPVAGAIGNAVHDALSIRARILPLSPQNLARAIEGCES